MRLTELAHRTLATGLRPGDKALDATLGNGHDCLFLARRVGDAGRVVGLDIQPRALAASHERLEQAGMAHRVRLILGDHAELARLMPGSMRGQLQVAMFNLGYLPGGDRRLITRAESTRSALRQTLEWLKPGGMISILCYPGHAGGEGELTAVTEWLDQLPGERCRWRQLGEPATARHAPQLFILDKLDGRAAA
jgi:SAM-dependent methyltransferase